MASSTPYKPSPLSPRKSPFRRPESPASPSPLRTATPILAPEEASTKPTSPLRNTTNRTSSPIPPTSPPYKPTSPLRNSTTAAPISVFEDSPSPTKSTSPLRNSTTASSQNPFETSFTQPLRSPPQLSTTMSTPRSETWTPRGLRPTGSNENSPTKAASRSPSFPSQPETSRTSTPSHTSLSPSKRPSYGARAMSESNALSKLQPAQVRELRECFQILDRDSDGVVDADDVRDMLNQLGLPSSDRDIDAFFPSDRPQTSTMAVFLTQISTLLATLSPSAELLNAFSAFDDDDSGQVDLAELRDALLHTLPEQGEQALTASEVDRVMGGFSGRRAFGKTMSGGKRGEVFKYQEFVNSIAGGQEKGVKVVEG